MAHRTLKSVPNKSGADGAAVRRSAFEWVASVRAVLNRLSADSEAMTAEIFRVPGSALAKALDRCALRRFSEWIGEASEALADSLVAGEGCVPSPLAVMRAS